MVACAASGLSASKRATATRCYQLRNAACCEVVRAWVERCWMVGLGGKEWQIFATPAGCPAPGARSGQFQPPPQPSRPPPRTLSTPLTPLHRVSSTPIPSRAGVPPGYATNAFGVPLSFGGPQLGWWHLWLGLTSGIGRLRL